MHQDEKRDTQVEKSFFVASKKIWRPSLTLFPPFSSKFLYFVADQDRIALFEIQEKLKQKPK